MKIKVAELIPVTANGGVETLVKDYALLINQEKFELIVIAMQRVEGATVDRILKEHNVKIISLYKNIYTQKNIFCKIIRRILNPIIIPYKINMIIQKENIDVLHIHLGVLRHIKKISQKLHGIKLFYTCHCVPELAFSKKELNAAKYLIKNNNLNVIALHEKMKERIDYILGVDSTYVIKNGIDYNRFKNIQVTKEQYRNKLGIKPDAFVIGHIGRFDESKNHSFLIKVFYECHKKNNNAYLLLIGDGHEKESIVSQLNALGLQNDYVILSDRTDIPELLQCMDTFVFPSKNEGFGIVLIEAQVSGIRCVASDSIPKEAFQTDLAIPVSLTESPQRWCSIILDTTIKGHGLGNINQYNMREEIKKLENLYCKELL